MWCTNVCADKALVYRKEMFKGVRALPSTIQELGLEQCPVLKQGRKKPCEWSPVQFTNGPLCAPFLSDEGTLSDRNRIDS